MSSNVTETKSPGFYSIPTSTRTFCQYGSVYKSIGKSGFSNVGLKIISITALT